jgi:hypothetical protein
MVPPTFTGDINDINNQEHFTSIPLNTFAQNEALTEHLREEENYIPESENEPEGKEEEEELNLHHLHRHYHQSRSGSETNRVTPTTVSPPILINNDNNRNDIIDLTRTGTETQAQNQDQFGFIRLSSPFNPNPNDRIRNIGQGGGRRQQTPMSPNSVSTEPMTVRPLSRQSGSGSGSVSSSFNDEKKRLRFGGETKILRPTPIRERKGLRFNLISPAPSPSLFPTSQHPQELASSQSLLHFSLPVPTTQTQLGNFESQIIPIISPLPPRNIDINLNQQRIDPEFNNWIPEIDPRIYVVLDTNAIPFLTLQSAKEYALNHPPPLNSQYMIFEPSNVLRRI